MMCRSVFCISDSGSCLRRASYLGDLRTRQARARLRKPCTSTVSPSLTRSQRRNIGLAIFPPTSASRNAGGAKRRLAFLVFSQKRRCVDPPRRHDHYFEENEPEYARRAAVEQAREEAL